MKIDLLYFDGCPSWQSGLENLKAALAREGLQAEINLMGVDDDAEAARLYFLGSPSFQVNGTESILNKRLERKFHDHKYDYKQFANIQTSLLP